jgi:hypothetical protein
MHFFALRPRDAYNEKEKRGGEGVLSVSEIASSLSHLFHNTSPHAQQHTSGVQ